MTRSWPLVVLFGLFGACRPEYDVERQERLDVFRQNRLAAIDLLLVVDNSCSMVDEQEHLALSFEDLILALQSGQSDWRVAVTTSEPSLPEYRAALAGGADEIVLVNASGQQLDRVAYDDTLWPINRGVAFERCDLESSDFTAFEPTDGEGSPGQRNTCGPTPLTGSESATARAPSPGEIVVSEFLPWPDAGGCSWVELANISPDTLDLSGVLARDDGRDALVLPAGAHIGPGGLYVFGTDGETCTFPVDLTAEGAFHLATGARWVDANSPAAASLVSELVAVGTGGFGLEMGMENALLSLEAQADASGRSLFLRKDADLALLFFSDEDDLSPWSVAHYSDALRALKGTSGQREPHRVRVGVAVGTEPAAPGEPSCSSALGEAQYAERYLALAAQMAGFSWSICGDLSDVASQAGLTFSEQLFEFRLSAIPAIETLVVKEYASEDDDSLVGEMERGTDFTLEAREDELGQEAVWMVFPEGRVPAGAIVTMTYEIIPYTAELDLDEPGTP